MTVLLDDRPKLKIRKPKFDIPITRHWNNNDPFATAFFNALSISFPEGEQFFVRSVGHYANYLSEDLGEEVKLFSRQEMEHTKIHMSFNDMVVKAGYEIEPLLLANTKRLERASKLTPIDRLAFTVALEHLTASFASLILEDKTFFFETDPTIKDLWIWHSQEEHEHRAVVFDVLQEVRINRSSLINWFLRSKAMTAVCMTFWANRWKASVFMLRQDGYSKTKAHWGLFKYNFGKQGLLRKIIPLVIRFYLPRFHPLNR